MACFTLKLVKQPHLPYLKNSLTHRQKNRQMRFTWAEAAVLYLADAQYIATKNKYLRKSP
jgi:hypothetical protein